MEGLSKAHEVKKDDHFSASEKVDELSVGSEKRSTVALRDGPTLSCWFC